MASPAPWRVPPIAFASSDVRPDRPPQAGLDTLEDEPRYALAWLPAPFLPLAALSPAVPRVVRSLAPGGWLILAHGKPSGDALEAALDRLRTAAFGATSLDDAEAERVLSDAGLATSARSRRRKGLLRSRSGAAESQEAPTT